MSRSYKKHGIIKDKGMSRGEYNRRFRRVNRQRIKEGKEPKLKYEVTNPYNVCDWKIRWKRMFSYHLATMRKMSTNDIQKMKRDYFAK